MKRFLKSEDGQTAVEYVLLIAVMATIAFSIMKIAKERLLADADNCREESKSMICMFKGLYDRRDFVYYTIMRSR